ncbi:hypothetical protein [Burkholderia ubonensis]|uniref:hypothetical protein n=1 Tax=Burkholderia ubonensis TaxID=101571 RepID=UPI0012F86496|nr:hypothetical protein [Burkholderia ubonensis]
MLVAQSGAQLDVKRESWNPTIFGAFGPDATLDSDRCGAGVMRRRDCASIRLHDPYLSSGHCAEDWRGRLDIRAGIGDDRANNSQTSRT